MQRSNCFPPLLGLYILSAETERMGPARPERNPEETNWRFLRHQAQASARNFSTFQGYELQLSNTKAAQSVQGEQTDCCRERSHFAPPATLGTPHHPRRDRSVFQFSWTFQIESYFNYRVALR